MGNMFGPRVFVTGFVQGMGTEIGFALGGYKYDRKSVVFASIATTIASFLWNTYTAGYYKLEPWLVATMFVIRLISAFVFCFIAKALADRLAKAGVLGGYAIGQNLGNLDED